MIVIAYAKNKVVAGQYEGGAVVSALNRVSISGGGLPGPLLLSKDTVVSYEIVTDEHLEMAASGGGFGLAGDVLLAGITVRDGTVPGKGNLHYLALQFKSGEKSLLEVDRDLCEVMVKNCLAEAPLYCGVKPENIKTCDPFSEGVCNDCPCRGCVLWPKCCFARFRVRRTKQT
ncbi:MAG: hypothetical protein FWE19_03305 [Oscillospiraceae bacterium]|nr:hypothetical protein [Oscillospiraceae bacterium]